MSRFTGKHHSAEAKARISAKLKGRNSGATNPMFGKPNPMLGKHHSEATRAKMRERAKARTTNPMLGKHHSEEAKTKMRLKKLGKPLSEEHKAKMSEAHLKGRKPKDQTGRARAEKLFPCPKGLERHHIDGNPLNNAPENIEFVTRKQHMQLDGRL